MQNLAIVTIYEYVAIFDLVFLQQERSRENEITVNALQLSVLK